MPDRTVTFLSVSAGALFTVYILFVVLTIVFATRQTDLSMQLRDTEGRISELEMSYYAQVAKDNASSPASIGLVQPTEVEYAVAKPASDLSFAGK